MGKYHSNEMIKIGNRIIENKEVAFSENVDEILNKNYKHFRDELKEKNLQAFEIIDSKLNLLRESVASENIDFNIIIKEIYDINKILENLVSASRN